MYWIVKMKDGSIIKQSEKYYSTKLIDKRNFLSFKLINGNDEMIVYFDRVTGRLRFNHLDYSKLMTLAGGEEIKFKFNKDLECFVLDEESLNFLSTLSLQNEEDYFYLELLNNGIFNVNGYQVYMKLHADDTYELFNQDIEDFKYLVTANEDFYSNSFRPIRKFTNISEYKIQYNKIFQYGGGLEIEVTSSLIYDVQKRLVLFESVISSNKDLKGNIEVVYGLNKEANPIEMVAGEKKQIKKLVVVL
ncbi:MAG: hypothetical protein QXI16_01515 [Sulfolobaceae archaeon]